uniref:Uncharacterized protein n=1 Tax=Manihot esculenta TaxID=3983 RepID=A0A2C9USY9_MANES
MKVKIAIVYGLINGCFSISAFSFMCLSCSMNYC